MEDRPTSNAPRHSTADLLAPVSSRAAFALVVAIFLAAALRLEGIGQFSLSHYDEGVYVQNGINAAFGNPLEFNFQLPLHAPPLFPWAIGTVCWLLQTPWPAAGVVTSAFFGVATVPIVFLLARRLGGHLVGLVAAGTLALSDFHVAFSRAALTDVPLTFWFVVSIYCAVRLEDSVGKLNDSWRSLFQPQTMCWISGVGLTTAVAWNTKYNGWMPVAIAMFASAVCWLRASQTGQQAVTLANRRCQARVAFAIALAALIALLGYMPWFAFVNQWFPGGYDAITAHHRTYVGGVGSWPAHLWRHAQMMPVFRHYGWLLACGCAAAASTVGAWHLATKRRRASAVAIVCLTGVSLVLAILTAGLELTILLVAIAMAVPTLWRGRYPEVLIACWLITFVVAVPFYHPYSRLFLPLIPAAACLSALAFVRLLQSAGISSSAEPAARPFSPPWSVLVATGAALIVTLVSRPFGILPGESMWHRWSATNSYQSVTSVIDSRTAPNAFVICQAQPPLSLYVPRERVPIGNVAFTSVLDAIPRDRPCYLALDFFWLHAQPSRDALVAVQQEMDRLELVATIENDLSLVTLADFLTPRQLATKLRPEKKSMNEGSGIPPALETGHRDTIAIFAIRRE